MAMTREQIEAFLLKYAWMGTPEERAQEVACIMSQDDWKLYEMRADMYAGAQAEPGPEAYEEGIGFALSELYECHGEPHLKTCPHYWKA